VSTAAAPASGLHHGPNRLTDADWHGLGDRSADSTSSTPPTEIAQIVDLLEFEDPFAYNKGTKRGALVEATVGKGRWLYVGLGLWRQLPAGTEGAYRLMANLISLGSATNSPAK
jgi:hypothetical protein